MNLQKVAISWALAFILAMAAVITLVPATMSFADESPKTPAIPSTKAPAITTDGIKYATPIPKGTYFIQSSVAGKLMLSVADGKKHNGNNVRIFTANESAAQRWKISYDSKGLYSIKSAISGKYLTLKNGNATNGNNVYQWEKGGKAGQKWIINPVGSGYTIIPAENEDLAVSVMGAAQSTTNVGLATGNGSAAQKWMFISTKPKPASTRIVANGFYEIRLADNSYLGLNLVGGKTAENTNIRLARHEKSIAQRWYITWEKDGYYSIRSVASSMAMTVADGKYAARTNIQANTNKKKDYQRWAIQYSSNGNFVFINKATGLALDVQGASVKSGANAQTFVVNNGTAQQFKLKRVDPIAEGAYKIYSIYAPTKQVLSIPKNKTKNGVVPQTATVASSSMAQKFAFVKVAQDTYTITALCSGKQLAANSAGKVYQTTAKSNASQQWKVKLYGKGLAFINKQTGKPLTLAKATSKSGTKVRAAKLKARSRQFRLASTNLIETGNYKFVHVNGLLMDVKNGSYNEYANIQAHKTNGTGAQVFSIAATSNGYYKICNAMTSQAIGVKNASKKNGANVRQRPWNGSDAQQWKPALDKKGRLVFINKHSGKALDVANGGAKNGNNVRQRKKTGSSSQAWGLVPTTTYKVSEVKSGNKALDNKIDNIIKGLSGNTKEAKLRAAYDKVVAYPTILYGVAPTGSNWSATYALRMINNGGGDCYHYAALFEWLAKGLGYDAKAVYGTVPKATGGLAPHAWTEVKIGGVAYICDPNLQHAEQTKYLNWYMINYSSPYQGFYVKTSN